MFEENPLLKMGQYVCYSSPLTRILPFAVHFHSSKKTDYETFITVGCVLMLFILEVSKCEKIDPISQIIQTTDVTTAHIHG